MKRVMAIALAFFLLAGLLIPVSAATTVQELENTYSKMLPALIIMLAITFVLIVTSIAFTIRSVNISRSKRRKNDAGSVIVQVVTYIVTLAVLVCTIFCFIRFLQIDALLNKGANEPSIETPSQSVVTPEDPDTTEDVAPPTEELTEPITEPVTEPVFTVPTLTAQHTENTDPANWNINWQLQVDGETTDSYQSPDTYNFTHDSEYFALPGVPSFRGSNYRTGAAYGTATIDDEVLIKNWCREVGSLNGWPGIGWTGQPLCVQWDAETRAIMNLYEEKKNKDGLVEVIATTLDGNIYFYDIDDGSYTRDPIWIGMGFKGTASLDPRGYPILYAGSGLNNGDRYPRMFIVSLIDGSLLMEQSGGDSFAHRGWYAFDSSPMISGETDTLFWPGESGVLYSIKLNTQYDKSAGTLSMSPSTLVKTRYTTKHSDRSLGYEASAVMVGNYMFVGDNGGYFFCIDLHTMQLAWAQYVKDDVNATPIFEWGEDGEGYLYVATSTQYSGNCSFIYKLNATTGEIVWEKEYTDVAYDYDVSGGALSSPVLGKPGTDLEGLIIFSIAKTPGAWSGRLFALDTDSGEIVWERTIDNYAWSSPVGVYTDDGKGYLVLGDSVGYLYLIDGATGKTLYTEGLGSNIEASPVVFNNKLVVGTRGCQVWGIIIK